MVPPKPSLTLNFYSASTVSTHGLSWKSSETGVAPQTFTPDKVDSFGWSVFGRMGYLRVVMSDGVEHRLDGFSATEEAFNELKEHVKKTFDKSVSKVHVATGGASFGVNKLKNSRLKVSESVLTDNDENAVPGKEIMSFDLREVSQCVMPGNNRNEIELQFHESDTLEKNSDQLVQIRFYVPPDADVDPTDKTIDTEAQILMSSIMGDENIKQTTGTSIAEFEEATFLSPRGRYSLDLFDTFLRMHGNKYDFKIKYSDISKLFLLDKADEINSFFIIALEKPIRQGNQRYQYLVVQVSKEHGELNLTLPEPNPFPDLDDTMSGKSSNMMAKIFKAITKKKVFVSGKFQSKYEKKVRQGRSGRGKAGLGAKKYLNPHHYNISPQIIIQLASLIAVYRLLLQGQRRVFVPAREAVHLAPQTSHCRPLRRDRECGVPEVRSGRWGEHQELRPCPLPQERRRRYQAVRFLRH